MSINILTGTLLLLAAQVTLQAQPKKAAISTDINDIPLTKAELGTFPYVRPLPNSRVRDSVTIEHNRTYFFDGKTYITVDGQVSAQKLEVRDDKQKTVSEFQIIQTFDQLIATLGGKKIYEGKLPEELIKKMTGHDLVELGSRHQVAGSAYSGVTEYVIRTAQKDVWIQVVASTIGSHFYELLVVEQQRQLLSSNINKVNQPLSELERTTKAITHLDFAVDKTELLSQSGDELLALVGIFQAHPNWKLRVEVHSAPIGQSAYVLDLTQRRAVALKNALVSLGVPSANVETVGLGDSKPMVSNDTEDGRRTNTRIEVIKR